MPAPGPRGATTLECNTSTLSEIVGNIKKKKSNDTTLNILIVIIFYILGNGNVYFHKICLQKLLAFNVHFTQLEPNKYVLNILSLHWFYCIIWSPNTRIAETFTR